jgi:hypothetical protein
MECSGASVVPLQQLSRFICSEILSLLYFKQKMIPPTRMRESISPIGMRIAETTDFQSLAKIVILIEISLLGSMLSVELFEEKHIILAIFSDIPDILTFYLFLTKSLYRKLVVVCSRASLCNNCHIFQLASSTGER